MKKIIIFLLMTILLLSGCNRITEKESEPQAQTPVVTKTESTQLSPTKPLEEFSFRGHKFWDTLEQVIEKEGEYDRYEEYENSFIIFYDCIEVYGYTAELEYIFYEDGLYDINAKFTEDENISLEEKYYDIKQKLIELCGQPTSEDDPIGSDIYTAWMSTDQKFVAHILCSDEKLSISMRAVM